MAPITIDIPASGIGIVSMKGSAGGGAGVVRFEIYNGGVATGGFVEFGNNTSGVNQTSFPVQATINVNNDFDARYSVVSGTTVGALSYASFTVVFEIIPEVMSWWDIWSIGLFRIPRYVARLCKRPRYLVFSMFVLKP